jgi:NodT family efflux transporter outer membrane factor (OMF) lipoprotein
MGPNFSSSPGRNQPDGAAPTRRVYPRATILIPGIGRGGSAAMHGTAALATSLALLLAACAPDLGEKPMPQDPARFAVAKSFAAPETGWPQQDWWKAYGDGELDALIAEALLDSPNLKIAAARVRAAEAAAAAAGADLWPTVNASGSLIETEASQNQMGAAFRSALPRGWHHAGQIAVGLDYQLDFFGRNRAQLAAATGAAEAARADAASARLQISAAVAGVYADLRRLLADRKLAEAACDARRETAALVRRRYEQHLENRAQLAQAEAMVAAARLDADILARQITLARNQLAALLGKGPDRGLSIDPPVADAPLAPAALPGKLALDLIGRRPDIVAARKRAAAAAAAIDMANANFYPNVDLVGAFGVQSLDAKYLMTASSEMGQFGPAISLPIFDYGRLTGIYRKSRADYDAAVSAYDLTLTEALHEVADAYVNRRGAESELRHAREMLAAGEAAYASLKARYHAGITPYIEVLTAETAVLQQRRTVSDLTAQAFVSDVALIRALGGGYAEKTNND